VRATQIGPRTIERAAPARMLQSAVTMYADRIRGAPLDALPEVPACVLRTRTHFNLQSSGNSGPGRLRACTHKSRLFSNRG
jgi:hypothetical protein